MAYLSTHLPMDSQWVIPFILARSLCDWGFRVSSWPWKMDSMHLGKNRWHLVDWMGHRYPSMRSVTIFKPMFSIEMKGKPIGSFSCCPICLLHRDAVDSHIYDGWFPSWNHSFDFFAWQMVLRQYENVCICIESSSAFHRSNAQHLVFNIDQPPRWLWHSQFAMV